MAHFSINGLRERFENARADTKATTQGAEELTQPLGGNDGDSLGESGGSGGADEQQTDTDNDVAGLGDVKSETKPKSRAK